MSIKGKDRFAGWEAVVVLVFLLVANGAYAATKLMPFAIGISIVILLVVIYRLITQWKPIALNWLTLGCWFIAFSYSWSFFNALSVENTLLKMVEWFTYGLILLWIPQGYVKNARQWMRVFSIVFVLVHIGILLQLLKIDGAVLFVSEGLAINNMRLNGILQYANTTGAIAGMLFLYSLYTFFMHERWRYVDIILLFTMPFILLLTESRGALLVIAISFIVGLVVMEQQLQYALLFILSFVVALIAYSVVVLINGTAIAIVVAIAIIFFVAFIVEKYMRILKWEKPRWLLPCGAIGSGIIFILLAKKLPFLPDALQNRLSLATLADRIVYMQDGWQAIKEFFLFGAGGEAWQFAIYEYQSAPYIANDLHMFYEQHWLETGFIGFILLIVLLLVALWKVIKQNVFILPPILVLLLHASFDFTLSFGLVIMLLLLLFYEGFGESTVIRFKFVSSMIGPSAVSLIIGFVALSWQQGENAFRQYDKTGQVTVLEQAIDKNPFATRFYEELAKVESPLEMYETILTYEPHHARILFYAAEQSKNNGDIEKALYYYEQTLTYDRFDRVKYELVQEALDIIGTKEALALKDKLQKQLHEMERLATLSTIQDQRAFIK